MGQVVKFHAQGKEYPLSVWDVDGGKWVVAQQLGEAMGTRNIKSLLRDLEQNGEIKEDIHFRRFTLLNSSPGNPRRIILSYRGVIRVAMRSQGQRAREFRDWAEDVLYEVMTTGTYVARDDVVEAMRECLRRGYSLRAAVESLDTDLVARIVHYRKAGLSQQETAAALGISRWKVQRIEGALGRVGVTFRRVHTLKRDRQIRESLLDNLLPAAFGDLLPEGKGGAR